MTTELMQSIERERAARQQAWEDFVAAIREWAVDSGYEWVLYGCSKLFEGDTIETPMMRELKAFAAEHGWPDTLRAIAQAMAADERHRRELVDRR
jgi:hypothetical protein